MNRFSLHKRLVNGDCGWSLRANGWGRRSRSRVCFAAISRLGDGIFWYLLMAAMIAIDGLAGLAVSLHLAATGLTTLLLYKGLKHWSRRPRPFAADKRIHALTAPLDEFSFPSGHTLHAVAFSVVAVAYYPMLAWLLVPFTAAVAASRVVLGLHYPSDVLAAVAIGAILARLSLWLLAGPMPFS